MEGYASRLGYANRRAAKLIKKAWKADRFDAIHPAIITAAYPLVLGAFYAMSFSYVEKRDGKYHPCRGEEGII
ncbi:MAG: hypothetical protein HY367_00995 [Candidatus Aenigmarchaeota archaeon]|nr:hypothetical protein [Candidatus Aenigmarchaeota archaeon]